MSSVSIRVNAAAVTTLGALGLRHRKALCKGEGSILDESNIDPPADVQHRVEGYVQGANFAWVTQTLQAQRDSILGRWLDAVAEQPFHHGHREHAIADHIPELFDALIYLLQSTTPKWIDPTAPLDDEAVLTAARNHASVRVAQGLQPVDVVVEFRLLRQEIWHALRQAVPDSAPTSDVLSAELVVNDALDGAISLGLSALTERIEQLREEFLATTVHEVRQPMTVVSGAAQIAERLLAQENPDLNRLRSSLQTIRNSVSRMNVMLGTLSDTSRLALGNLVLQPSATNIVDITTRALADSGPETAGRVSVEVSPGFDGSGWWDAERLEQVLVNLLSNAVKYSPQSTPVEVSLDGDEFEVRIAVTDHGIGIPSQDITRLFSRYVRAQNAADHGVEGLGLGLYLCRGIVEAQGGRITAESPGPNEGTTMRVVLPRRPPEPELAR